MSISISQANSMYGGATESETLRNMAESGGYRRIYRYANHYGDQQTHTDYKRITSPNGPEEADFFNSPYVHNYVLVYDDGEVLNLEEETPEQSTDPEQTERAGDAWEQTREFVVKSRAAGRSDEQIVEAFRESGWTDRSLKKLGLLG